MADEAPERDVLSHLLIVPGAHVRIGDFDFQAATYEEFHRHWATRVLHMLCTPLVLIGTLVLLNALPFDIALGQLGHVPAGGVVLAVGLAAYFVGLDAFVGLVGIPVVCTLLAASVLLTRAIGDHAVPLGLALTIGATIVQAGSHLFEPVPPPWSGEKPRALGIVMREASPRLLAGLALLTLVSFALEWWASFRVLGLQLNFWAMRLGLRPALRARIDKASETS